MRTVLSKILNLFRSKLLSSEYGSPAEYLHTKMIWLTMKCPSLKYTYTFDRYDNTHIIEIRSVSISKFDQYSQNENEIKREFDKLYRSETLKFNYL